MLLSVKDKFKSIALPGAGSMMHQMIALALPVIGSSFMTMAYNFINMIFVGNLGSDAVAAVGTAGFFMNLSWGLSALIAVGAGIRVSHAIGKKDTRLARSYVRSGILAIIGLALAYYLLVYLFADHLIGLVQLRNAKIELDAVRFLRIVGMVIPFTFQNLFFTSIFIGAGDSKSPFRINALAFGTNILLDYLFIFHLGMGINGAALGTIISQSIASILFHLKLSKTDNLKPVGTAFDPSLLKDLLRLGISPTVQRVSFTIVAIGMARIISGWGATAIAVQKIGIQVEAISYMTGGGFLSALSTISGQAYGAGNYRKQWQAFRSGILLAFILGIITSGILIVFARPLFSIFLTDTKSVTMGTEYLTILGFSQLFMVMELIATGAFFGWGKTNIPAISSIVLTVLRIPMAMAFITLWKNELSSVWWSISISSMAKGTLLVLLYVVLFKSFISKQLQ